MSWEHDIEISKINILIVFLNTVKHHIIICLWVREKTLSLLITRLKIIIYNKTYSIKYSENPTRDYTTYNSFNVLTLN